MPLLVTLAIQIMVSMAALTMPVIAPIVAVALQVPIGYLGGFVALLFAGAMLSSLAAAPAVGRFGAIRVSQAGLVLCAAGLLLCAIPSVYVVAVGAVLIGLGYGPITPASSHLLALTTSPRRLAFVFSIKQTGVPLGGMLAGALLPGLMMLAGWQAACLAVAIGNLLFALAANSVRESLDADRDASRVLAIGGVTRPLQLLLSNAVLRRLTLTSFVFSTVQLSLTTYLVTYLTTALGYSLVTAGLVLSLAQVGGMTGRIAWGYVSDRWLGARRTLAVLALVMMVCTLILAMATRSTGTALILITLLAFGASAIGWNGVFLAEVSRQSPPGSTSTMTSGALAVTYLGIVLGPALFGLLYEASGSYRVAFAVLAVPVALCLLNMLRR